MMPLRIVFFGTPDPACDVLLSLIESSHKVVGVITQPDKKRGRGSALVRTPVKIAAQEAGIDVFEPSTKKELSECVAGLRADVGVVVAYGRILPVDVLTHFPHGCVNVHYSLLPRWRGAAPVERAILEGDAVSGVSIMSMDEGLDTGAVYATRQVDITESTTSLSLFASMNAIARDLLVVVLDSLDTQVPTEQQGEPTYAQKLDADDFYFDAHTCAVDIDRKIRAGSLVKGAWTFLSDEKIRIAQSDIPRIENVNEADVGTINRAGVLTCVDGTIQCKKIQVPGKPLLDFVSWANGVPRESFPLRIKA